MNKYRANRSNYIFAYLSILVVGVLLALLSHAVGRMTGDNGGLNLIVGFFIVIGAVYLFLIWARMIILRSRDFNFPGWAGFLLAFFFNPAALVFAFIPGTKGENQFGPQPSKDISLKNIFFK